MQETAATDPARDHQTTTHSRSLRTFIPPHHNTAVWAGQIKVSLGDHFVLSLCAILPAHHKATMDRPDQGELWRSLGAMTMCDPPSPKQNSSMSTEQLRSKYNNVIWLDPGTGTGRRSLKALFPLHLLISSQGWLAISLSNPFT